MHKKAMELAKTFTEKLSKEDICSLTPQEYENAKNISETLKNLICAEKDYLIVEAMKESDEKEKLMSKLGIPENGRMGYNHNRLSNGRFTTSGRARIGYQDALKPYLHMTDDEYMEEYLQDPNFMTAKNRRMGYTYNTGNHNGAYTMNNSGRTDNSRYGYMFDDYREAKHKYAETKSQEDKMKMKEHREKAIDDIQDMIVEMWKDMEPSEKDIFKSKISQKMI